MQAVVHPRWVVAQTQPLCERRATTHIARQGGHVYAPFFYDRRRGSTRLFPGYLFVHLQGTSSWLNNTMGVLRVICMGVHACEVSPRLIDNYESLADERGVLILPQDALYSPGQRVRIIGGPLVNATGIVEGMDAQQRVFVLLSMLGRETRVQCPVTMVTAA